LIKNTHFRIIFWCFFANIDFHRVSSSLPHKLNFDLIIYNFNPSPTSSWTSPRLQRAYLTISERVRCRIQYYTSL
jgi:hypothetical protein